MLMLIHLPRGRYYCVNYETHSFFLLLLLSLSKHFHKLFAMLTLCLVKFVRFNVILLLLLFSGKVEVRCGENFFFTYLSRIFTSYWSVIFTSYISNPVISYVLHFQSTRLARAVKFAVFWAHGDNYYQVWGWYAYPFLFHCINAIDTFDLPEHTHTHTRLTALCPGVPEWAGTKKVKPIWVLLEQDSEWLSSLSGFNSQVQWRLTSYV